MQSADSSVQGNINPGDDAPLGTPGTGEDICRTCRGTGKLENGSSCPDCGGTGKVVEGIGGG
jgi:RecJ-like exonuclease